jgi:uncharacterized membrane protein
MKSRFRILGHPLHPMLVVFPLGLLVTSVIFDFLHLKTKKRDHALVANKLVGAGVLGGIVAAVPGIVDWLAIPEGTRAKRIGFWHGLGNIVLLLLFGGSWKLRQDAEDETPPRSAIGLSLAGLLLGNVTAWLGGELIYRLGVGVDNKEVADMAHLNAPNSLTHEENS